MPGSSGCQRRVAAALWTPVLALAGAGCIEAPDESRPSVSAASGVGKEVCVAGRPSDEGVECRAFRATDGGLYTLIGNLDGLAGEACVCGRPVEFSTCMQGTTLAVTRIGPSGTCP